MSSGLDELTVHAHQLVSDGDLHGARRVLTDALADADPHPANASPDLADAAGLLARILVALGEPQTARGWAAYTYAATTRLYGRSDPQTVSAAATLAAVLHRVGSDARAARLYSDVIIELTATDGPESLRVLAAHADLATVEYARGQCAVARDRLLDAWELHREVYGDGHPGGIKMLARLGAMQRDCGQYADAHRNLTYADELCRRHLAFDDPLAAQVAALGRASGNPAHVCADEPDEEPPAPPTEPPAPPEDGPPGMTEGPFGVPSARTALPEEGPPEAYTRPAWSESTSYVPPDLPEPTPYEPPGATEPVAYDPSTSPPPSYDPPAWSQPYPPTGSTGTVPAPRSPTDDDHGWPPADTFPAPASTVHQGRGGPEAPGVHRVRRSPAPEAPSRLLPVPVHRAPAQPRPNRLVPMIAAGVVVVVLGAAAVIAGVARVDGSRN
ncbi:tetratricopeptide repeat protein, partial [Micromonospora sp. NPDC000207]|uniref:tetratricopeptide repeat protein n=1 Tax=Micromonospora sp. NPDC000207 TaxID=3154246 RepID=UPI0033206A33